MIYESSEETDLRNSIVIALEKLLRGRLSDKRMKDDTVDYEIEAFEKKYELTEQMHLVLKLAMNLKDISK